jgi:hypothetical protein
MVGDHYSDKWKQPQWNGTISNVTYNPSQVSKEDFDALKKDVEEMKKLLERALDYDKRNNEPNCEMEEKVALLKKVAELVGVSLEDIFPKQ